MSITISNLRIIPYGQKDSIKPVFGDTMHLTFRLADAPLEGDRYLLGLDYERILFPTMRPLCAYTEDYTADQNDISFDLAINTERFALWASTLKKPTPIWLQLVRVRGEEYTTILLDDVLALPSVVDGANMVFPGTPLEDKLAKKLDKPAEAGQTGNVLKLGEDGKPVWGEGGGGGAAAWGDIGGDIADQADLQAALNAKQDTINRENPLPYAYLSGTPAIPPPQQQSDWDESDSSEPSYIRGKPSIPTQADYIPQAEKGVAGGVATLGGGGTVPDSELPKGEPITVIPAATSLYTLADGCYRHTPSAAPTYTLPTVTNATRTHWIVLDVSFSSVQTIAFEDAQGVIIAPLDTLTIAANDVVEYLCQYDALQSKWVIACGKLNS